MMGVYVTVPIACWRRGKAREYLQTEMIPPPSTCYGFLLSLVGETDRWAHIGVRVTAAMITREPELSVVLRTVWRVKKRPLGAPGNTRPDFQQLLTSSELVLWIDSSNEHSNTGRPTLEQRVQTAINPSTRYQISRFGGLSLGESTHLIDEIRLFEAHDVDGHCFVEDKQGRLTLPVWVDHVGSVGTRFTTGDIEFRRLRPPKPGEIPQIKPPD